MGRTARRTYELDDINIVPSRRTRSSQDVSTSWQLDAYRFDIPVLSHPTDALVSVEFAIELGRIGGLGVLNGEGLIGRHADVAAKIAEVIEAAEKEPEPAAAIRLLQQLHSAPLDPDLLGAAVSRIREAGVTTAVRVSPQNAQALTPSLVAAGIDLLVIQGTIVSAERVASRRRAAEPQDVHLRTGRAGGGGRRARPPHRAASDAYGRCRGDRRLRLHQRCDHQRRGARHQRADGDRDRRRRRRAAGVPRRDRRPLRACAGLDGDIHTSGDLAKAIACGADAVVLGTPLALAAEALGDGWFWPAAAATRRCPVGRCCRSRRGAAAARQVLTGPSDDPFGSLNLVGGLRRSMAKAGYCDLKEFQKVGLTVGS